MNKPVNFLELLEIDVERYPVIAVVGGGGKTSLICRLNQELLELGKKVIITTTTHMAYTPGNPFALGGDIESVKELLAVHGYVVAAQLDSRTGKLCPLSEERRRELENLCDVMLVEADGSRQLPLKVPENWEPVIPETARLVISVVGLDCLGKPIHQIAHRVERTAELLQKGMDAPVTPEDVVKIASSICGLFKNVEDRIYRVYLNKADILPEKELAEEILRGLQRQNKVAAYGSLKAGGVPGAGEEPWTDEVSVASQEPGTGGVSVESQEPGTGGVSVASQEPAKAGVPMAGGNLEFTARREDIQ